MVTTRYLICPNHLCTCKLRVMGSLVIVLFLLLVGPLALAYGVDSRLDERNRPW